MHFCATSSHSQRGAPRFSIQLPADSHIHTQNPAAGDATQVGGNPGGPELCKPMNELPSSIGEV